jgi:lysophospholipase L1-like esterase
MSAKKQITRACGAATAVAALFALHIAAVHTPARGQVLGEMPGAELPLVPEITPVAASAATPALTPAIVTPDVRQSQSDLAKPAQPAASTPAPRQVACTAPAALAHFDHPLLHTMRRLASGQPLTIVAIGSSSTAGARASSPTATYPARLAAELKARFADHDITVFNRGVNGEVTDDMLARFATDVIAAHPQLVLWQVGTNSVLRDNPLTPHSAELRQGIEQLKAAGADVVLIDPQYAPKVLAKSETPAMVDQIALTAKEENVDLFRRFAVMRDWHESQHLSYDVFVSPDQLHMNDWGYACWAKLIGTAIAEAATRPIASAAAHPAR